MHSPDQIASNIDKLAALFPSCLTEIKDPNGTIRRGIDFDQLRQELASSLVDGPQERYRLDWPGKREAVLAANAPIAKTLRPYRNESVNFDTTKNLFIEGDNLDALKLLRETYLGNIKFIYIDPPYNTGKEFIYNDDFGDDVASYFLKSTQVDPSGNRLVANTEANGRFHSDWLSMMFSRLRLAYNMLHKSGVIAISIDNGETSNLRKVCDEVFGEQNFVGTVIWKNVTDNNPTNVATEHESIHIYAKSKAELSGVWKSRLSAAKDALIVIADRLLKEDPSPEGLQAAYSAWFKENKRFLGPLDRYKYIDAGGVYTGSQSVHNPGKEGYRYDVLHPRTGLPCKPPLLGYRFPKSTMDRLVADGKIIFGEDHNKIIELKVYARDFVDKLSSVLEIDGRLGAYDLKELFPELKKAFTNPKPVDLLVHLCSFILDDSDTVLDFFSGSATTAHAVMKLNAADGGKRRFIMIQLPELCDEKSEATKAGFRTIAELSKERIRRAGTRVLAEWQASRNTDIQQTVDLFSEAKTSPQQNVDAAPDIGFRTLKVDASNLNEVYYRPDAIQQSDLLSQVDNIREGRSSEDLLFQVMLDWGVDLTLPVDKDSIANKQVYFVDGNALAACFETDVSEELVTALAKRRVHDLPLLKVVFRDASYRTDSVKINVEQIFKLLSPTTEVRTF